MAGTDDDALRVLTVTEALRKAGSRGRLRTLVRQGHWAPLRAGTYCTAETLRRALQEDRRHELDVIAAQRVLKAPTVASHDSAACMWGLPLPMGRPDQVCLTGRPDAITPRHYRALLLQAAQLPAEHVTSLHAIDLTTPSRTVVDMARTGEARPALAAIDAVLRRGVPASELDAVLSACRQWPGAVAAGTLLQIGDGRRETPIESYSAVMFMEQDLPMPEPQKEIYDHRGNFVARVDFLWEELGVIGEADGRTKYADDPSGARLVAEKKRQELLEDMGFVVVRWGWADVLPHRSPTTAARIRRGIARGAVRRRAG